MLRWFTLGIVSLAVWLLGASTEQKLAASTRERAQDETVGALVARINDAGLSAFRNHITHKDDAVAVAPLAIWYAQFMLNMGAESPPTTQEQHSVAALSGALKSIPDVGFNAGIWLNIEGTTYSDDDARAMLETVGAPTIRSSWNMNGDAEAPADGLMRAWLRANAVPASPLSEANEFVTRMNTTTVPGARSRHPLNLLVGFFAQTHGTVSTKSVVGPNNVLFKRFDVGDLRFFLYSGSNRDVQHLQSTLDSRFYAGLEKAGTPSKPTTALPLLEIHALGRFEPQTSSSFGTKTWTYQNFSGSQIIQLRAIHQRLVVQTVAGAEGGVNIPCCLFVDQGAHESPSPDAKGAVLCIVQERRTGVIVLLAVHTARER